MAFGHLGGNWVGGGFQINCNAQLEYSGMVRGGHGHGNVWVEKMTGWA